MEAHRRVEFHFAVFHRELRARIEFHDKLRVISLFAACHFHRVGAGQNSGALRCFKCGRGRGRDVRRLQPHRPFHAADPAAAVRRECVHQLPLRIENLQLHFSKNVTLALVVRNHGRIGRIRSGVHRASFHPAAVSRQPLLRGLGLEEHRLLRHHFGSQLAQRRNVVHDPDAAAMRGDDQVRLARVHHNVPHRHHRELMAFVLRPAFSAIR